jgi:myo-inositol-1(or 4)-monophosphatase
MTESTMPDTLEILKIAENTAKEAGSYLVKQLGQAKIKSQKGPKDDLLNTDLEAEHIILTKLRKETPHIGILSEEAGHEGRQDHYWIVDPLDGSANFQHGSPIFAITIALTLNEKTIAGIIYLPTNKEMFTAIQGQGAYLNRQPIRVSQTATLNETIINIGDFTKENDPETSAKDLKNFSKLATRARRVRMLGTAATDLAYVSCGRADALINHASHPWDIEAGKLLLLEAGGRVTTIKYPNSKPLCIYSNNTIHETLKKLLIPEEEPREPQS